MRVVQPAQLEVLVRTEHVCVQVDRLHVVVLAQTHKQTRKTVVGVGPFVLQASSVLQVPVSPQH